MERATNDATENQANFVLKVHKCKSQDTAREPSMREVNQCNQSSQVPPHLSESRKFIESKQVTERRGNDELNVNKVTSCPIQTAEQTLATDGFG